MLYCFKECRECSRYLQFSAVHWRVCVSVRNCGISRCFEASQLWSPEKVLPCPLLQSHLHDCPLFRTATHCTSCGILSGITAVRFTAPLLGKLAGFPAHLHKTTGRRFLFCLSIGVLWSRAHDLWFRVPLPSAVFILFSLSLLRSRSLRYLFAGYRRLL